MHCHGTRAHCCPPAVTASSQRGQGHMLGSSALPEPGPTHCHSKGVLPEQRQGSIASQTHQATHTLTPLTVALLQGWVETPVNLWASGFTGMVRASQ